MRKREFDARVGYFANETAFFEESQKSETKVFVRWRLEPKSDEDAQNKKGELIEPLKPIVYYIGHSENGKIHQTRY
jgi:hypothetical protein